MAKDAAADRAFRKMIGRFREAILMARGLTGSERQVALLMLERSNRLCFDRYGILLSGLSEDVLATCAGLSPGGVRKARRRLRESGVIAVYAEGGYGNVGGYSLLTEQGITISRCRGLRIGFMLSDDKGYIFGMPPFMVEGPSSPKGYPNAVRATPDQIEAIVAAIPLPETHAIGSASSNPAAGQSSSPGRPIALEPVLPAEVRQIEENIHSNPVQDFDLGRIVQVFSAYVQFVELKVEGAQLEARRVKLPDQLLTIIRDEKTRRAFRQHSGLSLMISLAATGSGPRLTTSDAD